MDADKTQLTSEQVKKASGGEEQTVVCPRCGAELTVFLSGNTPEERSGQIREVRSDLCKIRPCGCAHNQRIACRH